MDETQFAANAGDVRYFSRSWQMLTAEKGWIKPVLVLAAVSCVPVLGSILGSLALLGYALEWARLTAWGVDSVPKQRGVDVGGVLASGWRGFAVEFVWGLGLTVVVGAVVSVFSRIGLGALGGLLQLAASLAVSVVILVAVMRAAVYQRFSAGFGFSQIWEMARRDTSGLFRVFGVRVLGVLAAGVAGSVCGGIVMASLLPGLVSDVLPYLSEVSAYGGISDADAVRIGLGALASLLEMWPLLVAMKFGVGIVSAIAELLAVNACGLWFRQFDVPSWGSPSDPLPEADEDSQAPTL